MDAYTLLKYDTEQHTTDVLVYFNLQKMPSKIFF